jgi:hypothetical protein
MTVCLWYQVGNGSVSVGSDERAGGGLCLLASLTGDDLRPVLHQCCDAPQTALTVQEGTLRV